jgi:Phytanoyl-CoA dioxygenase (PhyH)
MRATARCHCGFTLHSSRSCWIAPPNVTPGSETHRFRSAYASNRSPSAGYEGCTISSDAIRKIRRRQLVGRLASGQYAATGCPFDLPGWGPWSRKAGVLYAHAPSWALSHIVALRIHLDASTSDNGPLRILPGTHSLGVMSDADVFASARSRPHSDCIVGRGGVMAMYPLLVHSSGKSRSSAPRRVLHIEYADSLAIAPGIQLAVA